MDSKKGKSSSVAALPPLTAEAAAMLQEGINLVLSRWTALQMAVLNESAGPHSRLKSQQLAVDLFSFLTQSKEKVDIEDLVDFLDDAMLETLNTQIDVIDDDDDSLVKNAKKLIIMHEGCVEGDFSTIEREKATKPPDGSVLHVLKGPSLCWSSPSSVTGDDDNDDVGRENSANGDSSMMAVDVPQSHFSVRRAGMMSDECKVQPAEDEDGWTVVASKRNKVRRN